MNLPVNIQGVQIVSKRRIADERGAVWHMLRRDDRTFENFGEIYFSQVNPGKVKAWHCHREMALNYLLVMGQIELVLFDDRKDAPTCGLIQKIILDASPGLPESQLVMIPPGIWNGFKCLSPGPSLLANCATQTYSEHEIMRRRSDDSYIPFDWKSVKGPVPAGANPLLTV